MTTFYFGERWDAPAFDDAKQIATPVGEPCGFCEVAIKDGDQGTTMPFVYDNGSAVRSVHLGCMLRSILGSADHLLGRCACVGGEESDHLVDAGADAYAEGLEVLAILRERMSSRDGTSND